MSKKLSKAAKEVHQYAKGDTVLGKIRGYPPWPGQVVDPSDTPPAVQNDMPSGKKSSLHCVMFFPTGDYGWLHSKDMSSLQRHEIEAFLADDTKKRNGDLREGYNIALNPHPWVEERLENARVAQEAADNEQVDQLESEGDADADADAGGDEDGGAITSVSSSKKAKTSKKRKRESEAAADTPKPAKKTPKAKKEKDSAEPVSAKKKNTSTAGGKAKKNGAKSKTTVESEDEGEAAGAEEEDENAGPSKKASPPPAKKAKRDKDDDGDDNKTGDPQSMKVRDWRHKLQKTFLSNKPPPRTENVLESDQLFTTVETYDEMTIEQLQFSKIGKVMRHIAALADEKMPPRDDEFKFRARAKGLVDKWHQILNANKPNASPSVGVGVGAQAQANGNGNGNGKVDSATATVTVTADKTDEDADADAEGVQEKKKQKKKKEDGGEVEGTGMNTDADAEADAEVTQGTKNLDINGKVDATAIVPEAEDQDAPAEADTSITADITMADA